MSGADPPGEKFPLRTDSGAAALKFLAAAASGLKSRLSGFARRLGFHVAGMLCAMWISQGRVADCFCAYIGLLCLIPSGFSPREIRFLFPTAIGLGHVVPLWIWGEFSLGQALFVAGLQSWLLGAIIRRFSLGWDWLMFPVLTLCALGSLRDAFPFPSLAFATLCGTAAYACAVRYAQKKEQAHPPEAERMEAPGKKEEFAEFEASLSLLRKKKKRLSPALHKDMEILVRAAGGILDCMREDPEDRPAGTRFLTRYLPAAHTILDEHMRLGESAAHAHVQQSLKSGAIMLERLAAAFQKEHDHLLRDDIMRFNAEMNTLDKLLKMDGR